MSHPPDPDGPDSSPKTQSEALQSRIQETEASLRSHPGDPGLLARLAEAYLDSGQPEQAAALAEQIGQLQSLTPGLIQRLGQQLLAQGQPWAAFQWLRTIRLDPPTKDLLNQSADRLEAAGKYDEAVCVLKHINEHDFLLVEAAEIRRREVEIATELELIQLHFNNARFAQAFDQCLKVLEMGLADIAPIVEKIEAILETHESIDTPRMLRLPEILLARGDAPRALGFLNKLFEMNRDFAKDSPRLSAVADALLGQQGDCPSSQSLGLGTLCLRIGRMDEAIEKLQKAAADPDLASQACRVLAAAYLRAGRYGQALEQFRAGPLGTADLDALYDLQARLTEAGATAEVPQVLRMIHRIDPSYRDVPERIAQLEAAAGENASPLIDPQMRSLIGDLAVGRYRYIRQIGSGGMGVVHEVFDIKNDTPVAMKILREGLSSNVKALTRFFREAQYLDQLNHPNIVRIFDFNISKTPGQSFIAMEMVDGPSLRQILEENFKNALEPSAEYLTQVLRYCVQVCEALQGAHKAGIVHRDIKPDNVMLNSRNVVKITDFGILHADEGANTPTGAMIGTPRYMAPEQVRGDPIDARCDIYAIGILLYEMLTGSPPFVSGDVAYQQIHVTPSPPALAAPAISPSLSELIMTCLEKDPARRFASAEALKQRLQMELPPAGTPATSEPAPAGAESPGEDLKLTDDMDEFDADEEL